MEWRSKSVPDYRRAEFGQLDEDGAKAYSFNGKADCGRLDSMGNPEEKRRKRVASYNMITMEVTIKKVRIALLVEDGQLLLSNF
ncbi:hypothetical protein QQ045_019452 [Rhodiola kirilowii]